MASFQIAGFFGLHFVSYKDTEAKAQRGRTETEKLSKSCCIRIKANLPYTTAKPEMRRTNGLCPPLHDHSTRRPAIGLTQHDLASISSHGSAMRDLRRPQPSRGAPLSSSTSPSTSLRYTTSNDIPEVLEPSTLRLWDVERFKEGVAGEGILVKLFPVSHKGLRSVGDRTEILWGVGAPNASRLILSKRKDAQKSRAKTSQAAKAGLPRKRRVRAKDHNGLYRSWKGQRLSAKDERRSSVAERERQGNCTESDEVSAEEEDEAGDDDDDDDDDDDGDGDEAGEDEEKEEDAEKHWNEQNADEQDEDEHNREQEEAQVGETDKGEDGEKTKVAKIGRKTSRKRKKEKQRRGRDDTRGRDDAKEDGRGKENADEDDEKAAEERGNHGKVRDDGEAMKQGVAASDQEGARTSWKVREINDKEDREMNIDGGEEEKIAGEEDRSPKEGRKRPFERNGYSALEDLPNKRGKCDEGESEHSAATDDLAKRRVNLDTTPRPRTSSPTCTTASPGSTLEVVRQTSVVSGLENTEKAVWDAAQRDTLSLGSEEGIKELQRFVHNARRDGRRMGKGLKSDFDISAPHSGVDGLHVTGALVSRDSGLAHFSALYRQIDILDNKATLFSITKRVKLAAMAQYRKGLVQEGAGKNQARDANLHLFRAIHPEHATIEKPDDKGANSAAYDDWTRLRDRLREGRLWLEIRDLFGGIGVFLALPPRCVADRHVVTTSAKVFDSFLRLLDVAWRALDVHARRTLNELVRMSLAGQPLPEEVLALELLKDGTGTALTSLSSILAGWSTSDRNSRDKEVGLIATVTERQEYGDTAVSGTPSTTTILMNRVEEAGDAAETSQKEMMGKVDDGLFNDLDFDDSLSQEI
ncbi:hypothetical protein Q7P37_009921 [Cladosporium fusiforme]